MAVKFVTSASQFRLRSLNPESVEQLCTSLAGEVLQIET